MRKFICCFTHKKKKKKNEKKVDKEASGLAEVKARRSLKIRLEHPVKPYESEELLKTSFSVSVNSNHSANESQSTWNKDGEGPGGGDEATEIAYEGEDEHEENASSMMRELSEPDLQRHSPSLGDKDTLGSPGFNYPNPVEIVVDEHRDQTDNEKSIDEFQTGHVSDPGTGKAKVWGSPKLKRSCSNVERGKEHKKISDQYSGQEWRQPGSPTSVTSHRSADRVMLKKRSSSHVLPSRSRKLWWKLFLWSHRNLHRPDTGKPKPQTSNPLNKQCGYSSDNVEHRAASFSNMQSPGSFTGESLNKGLNNVEDDSQSWDGFNPEASSLWHQNHWVALPIEPSSSSPFARVDEWVKELENQAPVPDSFDEIDSGSNSESIIFPPSPRSGGRTIPNSARRADTVLPEDILHANSVIQSLNSSSTVAHISGIGLRVTPNISCFTSLRTVNLSNNFIAYICPGSLPKGLHTLNLSKNKISCIEGLRELTRLRVLNLSYNRISRIGQGLSNCTMIKELYLAGNKISDVEGLHRLLKITVLDLSFNKITTTKALGQLVANYSSLQALNLLGNPIQSNISEEQLRKSVCGLLTKLVYLNKQPIKPQRAREVLTDSVAKAALGTGYSSSARRGARRGSSGGSSVSFSVHRGSVGGVKQRTNGRSKTRTRPPKMVPSVPRDRSREVVKML
ncbi:Outer arm dynein light chain 1 protein [Euphorbia peplus]|nr:Outer arm dynein light chain 1 protein [Euphorbia peplus]